MTKCGCETGGDCTKTTVCQCELMSDKLAEALEALEGEMDEILGHWVGSLQMARDDAQAALKEYRG